MSDLRMPKGWVSMGTNAGFNAITSQEFKQKVAKADKIIRNTKRMSIKELNEEAEAFDKARAARKASYDAAKKAGKLNSKAQKAKIKVEKAEARKAKRLAAKSA